jgi:hypothetical protein
VTRYILRAVPQVVGERDLDFHIVVAFVVQVALSSIKRLQKRLEIR